MLAIVIADRTDGIKIAARTGYATCCSKTDTNQIELQESKASQLIDTPQQFLNLTKGYEIIICRECRYVLARSPSP